jgi:hypothetical protein
MPPIKKSTQSSQSANANGEEVTQAAASAQVVSEAQEIREDREKRARVKAELKAEIMAEIVAEQEQSAKEDAKKDFAGFVVPENEKHLYHVSLEKVVFNSKTGQRVSRPYIQIFAPSEYKDLLIHGPGFTRVILHDPTAEVEEEDLA